MFTRVRRSARRGTLPLLSVMVVVAACEHELVNVPTREAPRRPASQAAAPRLLFDRPEEKHLRDIAAAVPSFAGFYEDSSGQIVTMVADSAGGAAASALTLRLVHEHAHDPKHRPTRTRVKKVRYTFLQLSSWRDLVTQQLFGASSGIRWDDADEVNNQVAIGIDASVAGATRAMLATALPGLGIPMEAVRIVEQQPAHPTSASAPANRTMFMTPTYTPHYLDNPAVPVSAGQQLYVTWSGTGTRAASAGFVVRMSSGADYVVTAAHAARAGLVDTSLLQIHDGTGIGHEHYDPALSSGVKNSDASLYSIDYSPYSGYGRLWRGLSPGGNGATGLSAIDTLNPFFVVIGTQTVFWVNQGVSKVGWVSGWTYGAITATCVDHNATDPSGVNWTRHCQHEAHYFAEEGDSGGAVFTSDGENGAYAAGIHWGTHYSWNSLWDYSIFSPWSGVATDMNNTYGSTGMTPVTNMSMGTPDLTGSYVSGSSAVVTWPAVSTANTTGTTTYKVFRTVWNAVNGTYNENGTLLTTTTSTSVTDTNPYFSLNSFNGASFPGSCDYSYVSYYVKAYNSGLVTTSPVVYFLGPFNPDGCVG